MTPQTLGVTAVASDLIVLGIDPGSYVAGYGVLRATRRIEYVQCGVLRLPKDKPLNVRLALLAADVVELIEEFRPVALAIERAYLDEHPQALLVLSEARGVVKGVALARGLRVLEFAPSTAKRAATGRGDATKPEVSQALTRRFRLERPPRLDASDGLAVALCGALEILGRPIQRIRPKGRARGAGRRSPAATRSG